MIEEISWSKPNNGWYTVEGWVDAELKSISVAFDELVEFVSEEGMNEYISDVLTGDTRRSSAYEYTEDNLPEIIEAYFKEQFKTK